MSTMIQVTEPTMVLNEEVCKSNIALMAAKAKAANVVFRGWKMVMRTVSMS